MEEKRLVRIDYYDNVSYFKLNESQCDLLRYLYNNDYLDPEVDFEFDAKINIVENFKE